MFPIGGSGGFNPAAPGAIGGTTPAAITGTTITATTFKTTADGTFEAYNFSNERTLYINAPKMHMSSAGYIGYSASATSANTPDTYLSRYAEKQLLISGDGTGATTNAGWVLGYSGISTRGMLWASTATIDASNFALQANGSLTGLNAPTGGDLYFSIGASNKMSIASTAGAGPAITAGTATTDVAALSITRTNNDASVATGVKWTFTDTSSAAGFLPFQILGGSGGTTNLFNVDKSGNLAFPGSLVTAGGGAFVWSGRTQLFSPADSVLQIANYAGTVSGYLSPISTGLIGVGTGAAGSFAGSLKATGIEAVGNLVTATQTPASNAAGTAGTVTWDASYIYICTATGVWKRAAITGGY